MENDSLFFENQGFKIDPSSGTIWPDSTLDVKVYFQPQRASEILGTAYCEVEGRESRMPLHLKVSQSRIFRHDDELIRGRGMVLGLKQDSHTTYWTWKRSLLTPHTLTRCVIDFL